MKEEQDRGNFNRLINHGPVLLLSTERKGKPNAMALAWHTPVSKNPPALLVAVSPKNYSYRLIAEAGEFVLNIPTIGLVQEVQFCGTHHGNDMDKLKEAGLTAAASGVVRAPSIDECIGHLECRVTDEHRLGDHAVFVSSVELAVARADLFDGVWRSEREELLTLHHLGGKFYAPTGLVREVEG